MKRRIAFTAMAAIMLFSAAIMPAYAAEFSDVPGDHPYKEAIDFCREFKFIEGYNSTTFGPEDNLTRGTFAVIWARTLQVNRMPDFTDIIKPRNWYEGQIFVLYSLGVINGMSENTFGSETPLNREQLAAFTARTYNLDSKDGSEYEAYTDHESISSWARDSVSACVNAGMFDGLFALGEDFEPQKNVTRAEVCKLVYNIIYVPEDSTAPETYTITVADLTGGTVIPSKETAEEGDEITLEISADAGMELVAGSLKYNDTVIEGESFVMPAADVTISAEFEEAAGGSEATLEELIVTQQPTKKTYQPGEALDLSDMVITAKFSDNEETDVTELVTTDPEEGATLNDEGNVEVVVSYTHNSVEKTVSVFVTVGAEE